MSEKLKVAVITGSHPFDVLNFQNMFKSFENITTYHQHMEDFVTDTGPGRKMYDVYLFYHMITKTPDGEGNNYQGKIKQVLTELGENNQGIFILHHSLVAFPEWDFWSEICGISNRVNDEVYEGVKMNLQIEDNSHYITKDLNSWSMVDEVYTIAEAKDNNDNQILLTTDHPKSMKSIAWTRKFKDSRVFCLASGHDNRVFSNCNFKKLIKRGIKWTANNR